MNEMSEYYQDLKLLKSTPKVAKKPSHKGNWNLIYILGKSKQSLVLNKPYGFCAGIKKRLLAQGNHKMGTFKFEPCN